MRNIRPLTALLLTAVLIFTTAGFACEKIDKAEFIAYARDIQQGFISFEPFIAIHKPEWKARWHQGVTVAGKFVEAVQASNKTEAVALIAELMPLVNEAFAEFSNNSNALLMLAGANIGLAIFANHYVAAEVEAAPTRPGAARRKASPSDTILDFKARRVWGCDLRPEKCRGLKKAA